MVSRAAEDLTSGGRGRGADCSRPRLGRPEKVSWPAHGRLFLRPLLAAASWVCNDEGEIVNRQPRGKRVVACFKHAQALRAKDACRVRVEGGGAIVGFAAAEGRR